MICSGLCLCLFTCLRPPLPIVAGGKDSQTGWTDFRGSGQQAREDDRATEERYLRGLDACEELLVRLDEGESYPA